MADRSASQASFIAAAVSLPVWVVIVGKCIVAFADDYNPAGVALWAGFSFVIAIPFGWIVGYLVSPAIYKGCNLSGLRWYTHAIFVHVIVGVVIYAMYLLIVYFHLHTGLWLIVAYPVGVSFVSAPMIAVPSLIGTLVYAYWSFPAVHKTAA